MPPAEWRTPTVDEAPIALLVDLASGQTLFAREEERRFAPASVTKVMTIYSALSRIAKGQMKLDDRYAVSPAAFSAWRRRGSTMYLAADARPTVEQLLLGIAAVSANDGAVVLAEGAAGSTDAWLGWMNADARRLGMRDSRFGSVNGFPDGGGTYTSARDLVRLASALIDEHPRLYRHFFGRPGYTFNGITQRNHDPISGVIAGADGLKTGYTDEAGYTFLGSAERDGRRLVMVIAASDTARQRDRAARALMEWGFQAFDHHRLFAGGAALAQAQVQGGTRRTVGLVAERPLGISVPRGTRPAVTMKVRYEGPLAAPIAQGDHVADLHVRIDGLPPYTVPLLAAQDVGVAGPLDRILNGFARWLR